MSEKETASQRYLVIEARWHQTFFARFDLALRDEESLRKLSAGTTVVGIGFGRFERGAAVIRNRSSKGVDSQSSPEHSVGLSETRRIAGATLQYAIAASVFVFYSKNVLGSALRALLGA